MIVTIYEIISIFYGNFVYMVLALLIVIAYLQINQIATYPLITAAKVKGTPI